LIPLFEELKKNGEKEIKKNARSILGILHEAEITAPTLNEDNENERLKE
jgi:hypothetical protein